MQALKTLWLKLASIAAVVIPCLLTQGCGWERTMTFPAPSRASFIEIWQPRFNNSLQARVELVTANGRTVLYTQQREAIIYLVHVYWSPDETKVGVLGTGFAIFSVAANVKTGSEVPFDQIRKEFAQSIRETYHLPAGGLDPFDWAATDSAQMQFSRLHPEIRLTYK